MKKYKTALFFNGNFLFVDFSFRIRIYQNKKLDPVSDSDKMTLEPQPCKFYVYSLFKNKNDVLSWTCSLAMASAVQLCEGVLRRHVDTWNKIMKSKTQTIFRQQQQCMSVCLLEDPAFNVVDGKVLLAGQRLVPVVKQTY